MDILAIGTAHLNPSLELWDLNRYQSNSFAELFMFNIQIWKYFLAQV